MTWTSPRTWVAGEKPSASTLNTHIRDNFKAIGDAWTAYTPTTTNLTLGNGTLAAAYIEVGKLIHFRIKFTLGSTSAVTGSPTFTLPVTATAARSATGSAWYFDSSASANNAGFTVNSTTGVVRVLSDASTALSATVPFTWATSDELILSGTYEAA